MSNVRLCMGLLALTMVMGCNTFRELETEDGGASCEGLPRTCGPAGNGNCCESVFVPAGSYKQTVTSGVCNDSSYPATVSGFYLDRYEVTVGRFRKFVEAGMGAQQNPPPTGSGDRKPTAGWGWQDSWNTFLAADTDALRGNVKGAWEGCTWSDKPGGAILHPGTSAAVILSEEHPINCVDWYTAFAFCVWDGGRLPTRAELGYAWAGGDEQRSYPWGNTTPDISLAVYACQGDLDGDDGCIQKDIQPVASRSPQGDGRWGHSDLAGNLAEWVMDSNGPASAQCDDCATTFGNEKVFVGGDFRYSCTEGAEACTTAAQQLVCPTGSADPERPRVNYVGFRCMRELPVE